MERARAIAIAAGRLAMSGVFVRGGWQALADPGRKPESAARLGLPAPETMVRLNGGAMVCGGIALALGRWRRAAPTGLIVSLAATTAAGHAFWRETDPEARSRQLTQFLKNLAMIGGLLVLLARSTGSRSAGSGRTG